MQKYETNLLQHLGEFEEFLRFIRKNNVGSYLEIGSKNGGSFWRIVNSLPKGSKVVSVDLPHGDKSFKNTQPHLEACVKELKRIGYNAHLFLGDSTKPETKNKVAALAPFDLCFIDANHTEPYVWADWNTYGPMAKIVAFHDISHVGSPPPGSKKLPIDVPKVWPKIKEKYQNMEIKQCPNANGIGIVWTQPIG